MTKQAPTIALISSLALLAACQNSNQPVRSNPSDNSGAIALLQNINKQAQACWTKSNNKAYSAYKVIPELDTRIGKPRILVLKARATQGLPQMVIEAEGTPPSLSSYGPLGETELGNQMNADIGRWSGGVTGCSKA